MDERGYRKNEVEDKNDEIDRENPHKLFIVNSVLT